MCRQRDSNPRNNRITSRATPSGLWRHIKTPAQWKAGRCFEKEQTTVAAVCHGDQEEEVCAIVNRFFSLFDGFIVYYKKYTIQ